MFASTIIHNVFALGIVAVLVSRSIQPGVCSPYGVSPFTGYGFNPIASAMYGYGLGVAGGYGGYGKGFGWPLGMIGGYGGFPMMGGYGGLGGWNGFGGFGNGLGYGMGGLGMGGLGMGGMGMGGLGMGGWGMGKQGLMGYNQQFGMEADFYKRMAEEERKAASTLVSPTKFAPGTVGQMMAAA